MPKIKIGDYVCYSREWLRSTGNFTGNIPQASGRVINIEVVYPEFELAIVEWNFKDIPAQINVKNLIRLDEKHLETV